MTEFALPQVKVAEGYHRTAIEWTDVSANPLRAVTREGKTGWACVKVSSGCANCYAESVNRRFGTGRPFTADGMKDVRVVLDEQRITRMVTASIRGPFRAPDGRPKCFIGDMTDIFGPWVDDDTLDCIFATFALRPDIDFQVLTKRPERMAEYLLTGGSIGERYNERETHVGLTALGMVLDACSVNYGSKLGNGVMLRRDGELCAWPLPNVWLGTSVEDQQRADERIPHLLRCPAAVRFLSVEPLLGPVDLRRWVGGSDTSEYDVEPTDAHCVVCGCVWDEDDGSHECPPGFIRPSWVIVGGESGPKARPCNAEWMHSVVRQCSAAGVPCFVKQLGACFSDAINGIAGRSLDIPPEGMELLSHRLRDPKGGDMSEWPDDLRVRHWPVVLP